MRALFLLLVLANLGFLGWSRYVDLPRAAREAPPPSELPADIPRLILAREAPRPSRPAPGEGTPGLPTRAAPLGEAAEVQPGADDSTVAAQRIPGDCVSIGPFRALPEAVQASAALRSQGFRPRERVEAGEIWIGHWVSLRGFASREEANDALRRLKDQGVTDAYVLPGSDPPNVISLGVFSDLSRAQRRRDQIRELGLDPDLTDRRQAGAVYWVDVEMTEPDQELDPASLMTEPGRIVRLELRTCASSAPDTAAAGSTGTATDTASSTSPATGSPDSGAGPAEEPST